ncbi:MAG TPA: (d)CMP kinase [Clostridiaceae bacterium]|nr:(d)CMP kinase [Clostridiaceae bacterium]
MEKIAIAIDGPSGAGKSTIAKIIADKLNITYIDTGAMYRAAALKLIRNSIDLSNIDSIKCLIDKLDICIKGDRIYLDGEDVTDEIRTPKVSKAASDVSTIKCVREKLVSLQRQMAVNQSVIMDGRDIGTNVLKGADVKIFLTASMEERAKRRYIELINKGYRLNYDDVLNDMKIRDIQDTTREINPLKVSDDSIIIDTTGKSIQDVVSEIISNIKEPCNQ